MGAVELPLAAESAGAEFHRAVRRDLCQRFLFPHRRRLLFARGHSAGIRRGEIAQHSFADHTADSVDCFVHRVRCVPVAIANAASAGLEARF